MTNVIEIWEYVEWAQTLGMDALFIKIKFEKAYDKVE
jgi:hypothetical protein